MLNNKQNVEEVRITYFNEDEDVWAVDIYFKGDPDDTKATVAAYVSDDKKRLIWKDRQYMRNKVVVDAILDFMK